MNPRLSAIVQARMGSTRYPGKVLRPLAGIPMIGHIVMRLKTVKHLSHIVLAIPDTPQNDTLERWANQNKIDVVKGPEEDVLQRYILAAQSVNAEHIVRICADSPLLDPGFLTELCARHLENQPDLSTIKDIVPIGTAFPIVSYKTLLHISARTQKKRHREHVLTFIEDYPESFNVFYLEPPPYLLGKNFRLTVDTDEDFDLMDKIYDQFCEPCKPIVDLSEVISFLETHPEIAQINAHVEQKDWRKE